MRTGRWSLHMPSDASQRPAPPMTPNNDGAFVYRTGGDGGSRYRHTVPTPRCAESVACRLMLYGVISRGSKQLRQQTFAVAGFAVHDELALYVDAGLAPVEVIRRTIGTNGFKIMIKKASVCDCRLCAAPQLPTLQCLGSGTKSAF